MLTIEDYRKALFKRYEEVKDGDFAEYLLHPTPARFKKLSIFLTEDLNAADKKVYGRFFKDENYDLKVIGAFDTDKLKPICNFVKGYSQLTNLNSLDFLAVLVDLESRPFVNFRKSGKPSSENFIRQTYSHKEAAGLDKTQCADGYDEVKNEGRDGLNFEEYMALAQKKQPEMSNKQAFFFGMFTFALLLLGFGYFYFSRKHYNGME